MNKYCYAILQQISMHMDEKKYENVTVDTVIENLFEDDFNALIWVKCLIQIELIYGFDIPDEIADNNNLTILQFSELLAKLPLLPESIYPDFLRVKTTLINDGMPIAMLDAGIVEAEPDEAEVVEEMRKRVDLAENKLNEIKHSILPCPVTKKFDNPFSLFVRLGIRTGFCRLKVKEG